MNRGSIKIKSRKVITYSLMVIAFFCLVLVGQYALAQTPAPEIQQGVDIIEKPLGLPATDIRIIITRIIRYALGLLGIIMVVLVMYGGFLWMTAGGNDEQIGTAKKVLRNAVIGLILILSAYSIVLFVMRMLGIDTSGIGGGTAQAPTIQRFEGSGALGKLIKDHYPVPNQIDVPRNTKIIVTFYKPVDPSSFIEDTNGSKIYGDCLSPFKSWTESCDRIKLESGKMSDNIINIKDEKNNTPILGGAILAATTTVNKVTGVYTIVIKPFTDLTDKTGGYLGSAQEKIKYSVRFGPNIKLDDKPNNNPSAFISTGESYYKWSFITDIKLDQTPPTIKSVYPTGKSAKNTVIQIDFDEAMDPTGIQGKFNTNTQDIYYELDGKNIYLISGHSKVPQGDFELSNGYRTLEFSSTLECGKNACGKSIYCLPVCDKSSCTSDDYQMLLKTGDVFASSSWEAIPFSGFMDVAGNAMDGNKNNQVDDPDTSSSGGTGASSNFPISAKYDNYYWKFTLEDKIDTTAPYLRYVKPDLERGSVSTNEDIITVYSKRMRVGSLYSMKIDEYPAPKYSMWYRFDFDLPISSASQAYTTSTMKHDNFMQSVLGTTYFYIPQLTSDIEDVNYNCFYPGLGPVQNPAGSQPLGSVVCNGIGSNCTTVTTSPGNDLYCGPLGVQSTASGYSMATCTTKLKDYSKISQ